MSISYDQEQRIREEERVRNDERRRISKQEAQAADAEEREEALLAELRVVKETHGFGAAFLMRASTTLAVGGVLVILVFIGSLVGDKGSFFLKLWEGIKGAFEVAVLTVIVALWKCRNI